MDAGLRTPHILAIDDEPDILEVYRDILTDEGYRVTTQLVPATDPADVRALAPDLIVLDLLIGHEDRGTPFLAMLKADSTTRDIPVLVCSVAIHRLRALEAQFASWDCGVVAKPFDIDDFLADVRACLAKHPDRRDDARHLGAAAAA